ncbi:MAG: RNA polymerase factor sigma-54 [bacterium]
MGDLKLNIKLSQQLVMTPQLQQAIKLLQMSRLEMQQTINTELMENPVLEEVIESPDPNIVSESAVAEMPKDVDSSWQNYVETYDANSSAPPSIRSYKNVDDHFNIENIATRTETLYDHLVWQLKMTGMSKKEETFGEKIIENINDDGYLQVDFNELAKDSGMSYEEAEEVLLKIQEFDPVGVGARDIKECLLQQVRQLHVKDGKLVSLIKNYLPDLEKRNYPAIARKLDVPLERVYELAKIVLSLEPKPGRSFSQNEAQYIVPDIYVLKIGNEYVISLNDDGMPRLRISNYYKNIIHDKTAYIKENDKEYINNKLRSAVALIRSIQHRQKTIYKVTEAIMKKQLDFLEHGVSKLRPMILREIAQDVSMHESTVSRVTTNKYVFTPQGIFELKFFFNNPVSSTSGDDVASESVREKIRQMITDEDTKNPLSDQQIADELKKYNIDIARRTVAKYREMLGLLPSSKRKKYLV